MYGSARISKTKGSWSAHQKTTIDFAASLIPLPQHPHSLWVDSKATHSDRQVAEPLSASSAQEIHIPSRTNR